MSTEQHRASIAIPIELGSEAIAMFRMVLQKGRSLVRRRNAIERRAEALLSDKPVCRATSFIGMSVRAKRSIAVWHRISSLTALDDILYAAKIRCSRRRLVPWINDNAARLKF